jgi:M6 family metalloprotease-like protein
MAVERRTYFAKVTSPAKRAAFVRKQQAKLKKLRAAAACTVVTPLPPSSGASCAFELEPNREAALNRPFANSPMRNLGPLEPGLFVPPTGRAEAVMVFVDFPDAPASENAAGLADMYTAYLDWFQEASHGRFSWNVTVVPTWFRMPAPGRSYGNLQDGPNGDRYLADAVAAVGGAVDFSRYRSVWVVPSSNSGGLAPSNFVRNPGHGVVTDGTEIRFGVLHSQSRRGAPFESSHMNHLVLASLGTSDLGDTAKPLGHWDPNFQDGTGARTAHLLGWHKWMLRWIDAEQLTCVHAPGTVEETLTPNSRSGGKKLVVVPTSPSTAYGIEVRRKLGYDRGICREGVLIYTVDSQILSGNGPIEGKSAGTGCSPDVMPFAVGETYEDAAVKVDVLATDGSAYRVRVTEK